MYFRVSVDYLEWKNDRKYLILQKISTHIETVSSLKGYNIHFCQSVVNIPNIFCQFKYFLGTRFPGFHQYSQVWHTIAGQFPGNNYSGKYYPLLPIKLIYSVKFSTNGEIPLNKWIQIQVLATSYINWSKYY